MKLKKASNKKIAASFVICLIASVVLASLFIGDKIPYEYCNGWDGGDPTYCDGPVYGGIWKVLFWLMPIFFIGTLGLGTILLFRATSNRAGGNK